MAWRCAAREDLDDDHATAAAWTSRLTAIGGTFSGLVLRLCHGEQFADACNVVGAHGSGKQAVVADAVEAARQDVCQKAADELACCERHALVSIAAFDPIVLPLEGLSIGAQT